MELPFLYCPSCMFIFNVHHDKMVVLIIMLEMFEDNKEGSNQMS